MLEGGPDVHSGPSAAKKYQVLFPHGKELRFASWEKYLVLFS